MCLFLNLCRQDMVPCEAEMSILGISTRTNMPSNFWSSSYSLETGSVFVGGLPHHYARKQVFFYYYVFLLKMFIILGVVY